MHTFYQSTPKQPSKRSTGTLGKRNALRCGFTLTELLIVIGLVVLLVALLYPAFNGALEKSRTAMCLAGMKRWSNIITSYAADHGAYPAAVAAAEPHHYWYTLATSYEGPNRRDFYCPQKRNGKLEPFAYNYYLGFENNNVIKETKPYAKVSPLMCPKPSKTAMFTDGSAEIIPWDGSGWAYYRKVRDEYNHDKHHGGANWVFLDGHGEWMTKERALELGGPTGDAFPFVRPF